MMIFIKLIFFLLKYQIHQVSTMNNVCQTEFQQIIQYGYKRLNNPDWDGLKMWNDIKEKYSEEVIGEWNPLLFTPDYVQLREYVLEKLPEFSEDGTMNEANHFIIQCLRIPTKNKFSARRLYQVAYNIGQLMASYTEYKHADFYQFIVLEMPLMATYYKM